MRAQALSVFLALLLLTSIAAAEVGVCYTGQSSGWVNYSDQSRLRLWLGGRYIPQLNVRRPSGDKMADLEASANLSGAMGMNPSDSLSADGKIKAYRLWARYSTRQLEIRLGLQKISFGSATLLRPLMWFDKVDPRDPLQLTDGVWGLLGRYYYLNNANIWLWLLYPSDQPKNWESIKSNRHYPEWGGRIQYPVPRGEIGLSGHMRTADARILGDSFQDDSQVREGRIGIDGKWDWMVGLWFEGAWIHNSRSLGPYTNQTLLTLGSDYTFGIGNGLTVLCENLWFAYAESGPDLAGSRAFSGLSLSYPLSAFDRLSAILYADWKRDEFYRFATWRKEYDSFSINLMLFWNPELLTMPGQSTGGSASFAGRGGQIMLIYNH
jgi:hypothetical protein